MEWTVQHSGNSNFENPIIEKLTNFQKKNYLIPIILEKKKTKTKKKYIFSSREFLTLSPKLSWKIPIFMRNIPVSCWKHPWKPDIFGKVRKFVWKSDFPAFGGWRGGSFWLFLFRLWENVDCWRFKLLESSLYQYFSSVNQALSTALAILCYPFFSHKILFFLRQINNSVQYQLVFGK